jgi:putative ABC transport system ATP-binding protein
MAGLEIRGLTRLFRAGVRALDGVDFEVAPGELLVLVGPSGSGKTTLLRLVAGLEEPTAGTVIVSGVDLYRLGARARARVRARSILHVYQRTVDNLLEHLTVEQQLARLVDRRHDAPAIVDVALERLGLTEVRQALPAHLSGGAQQRVALARALVAGHRIVVADEPTSQLDTTNADAVLDALRTLADDGATVVLATHDHRLLARVDQVITMRDGAVASVTQAGSELAVIDRSGRLQLPPDVRSAFPDRRARFVVEDGTGRIVLEQP